MGVKFYLSNKAQRLIMQNSERYDNRKVEIDELSSSILKVLLYFNIFSHPLTASEIQEFSKVNANETNKINEILNQLVTQKLIYQFDSFYSISNNKILIEKRIQGNKLAQVYLNRAMWVSRYISWFPFVKSIMISGSLSKGYMDKGSDIDYFIITQNGRLWICRSILALQRKLMIKPLKKYFCINYFVSTSSLAIPDHNLFTATEIACVYPTYGQSYYTQLQNENTWIKEFLPNKKMYTEKVNSRTYRFSLKTIIENVFNGDWGEKLDSILFKFMLKRWKKRYADFDETQFDLNIRTKKNVSKQHEKGHQFVILEKYTQQINNYEEMNQVKLTND